MVEVGFHCDDAVGIHFYCTQNKFIILSRFSVKEKYRHSDIYLESYCFTASIIILIQAKPSWNINQCQTVRNTNACQQRWHLLVTHAEISHDAHRLLRCYNNMITSLRFHTRLHLNNIDFRSYPLTEKDSMRYFRQNVPILFYTMYEFENFMTNTKPQYALYALRM